MKRHMPGFISSLIYMIADTAHPCISKEGGTVLV